MEIETGRLAIAAAYYAVWLMCFAKLGSRFLPKGSSRTIKYFIFYVCLLLRKYVFQVIIWLVRSYSRHCLYAFAP